MTFTAQPHLNTIGCSGTIYLLDICRFDKLGSQCFFIDQKNRRFIVAFQLYRSVFFLKINHSNQFAIYKLPVSQNWEYISISFSLPKKSSEIWAPKLIGRWQCPSLEEALMLLNGDQFIIVRMCESPPLVPRGHSGGNQLLPSHPTAAFHTHLTHFFPDWICLFYGPGVLWWSWLYLGPGKEIDAPDMYYLSKWDVVAYCWEVFEWFFCGAKGNFEKSQIKDKCIFWLVKY